ncbi:MAG: RnfABCDGE type electron transport complex subunit D [Bacilli bacterium]|nr:RnfABCDGE type electron transport complex subunit D [Bacilli bacterium]
MIIVKESAPHLRRKASVTRMMVDVLIALAPTLIFSFVVYPIKTLIFYLTSVAIMVGSEFVYVGLKNMMPADGQKHSFKERFTYAYKGKFNQNNILTAAISAIIFTLIMPAGAPIYAVIIGALVGIVLGKLVFGGLGSNIFNPAAVGMLFAKVCFGSQYVKNVPTWFYTVADVEVAPTVLTNTVDSGLNGLITNFNNANLLDMFLGKMYGTLGEVYAITILVGAIYLLIRRSADIRVMLPYLGAFAIFSLVAGLGFYAVDGSTNPFTFTLFMLLSGGVLFGGVFMLTDPVTSPINAPSRIIYALIAAVFTILIRLFAALPEGVGFSILIANMMACVLDHYEWSSSRYTWKKFLAMGLLVVIPALTIFLVIKFGGVYHV